MLVILLIMYIIRVNETVLFEGEVASDDISYIKSPCSTYVKELSVTDGEVVKKGQLLGLFDNETIVNGVFADKSDCSVKAGIIAPCDGVIEFVKVQDARNNGQDDEYDSPTEISDLIGRRFDEDEVVLKIVNTDNVYLSCFVKENDLPYICEKDKVIITFNAYPYERFGVFEGFIDRLYMKPVSKNGETFYKCEVRFTSVNREIKPYIGLKAFGRAIIKRDISLIEYLLDTTFNKK